MPSDSEVPMDRTDALLIAGAAVALALTAAIAAMWGQGPWLGLPTLLFAAGTCSLVLLGIIRPREGPAPVAQVPESDAVELPPQSDAELNAIFAEPVEEGDDDLCLVMAPTIGAAAYVDAAAEKTPEPKAPLPPCQEAVGCCVDDGTAATADQEAEAVIEVALEGFQQGPLSMYDAPPPPAHLTPKNSGE